MSAVRAFVNAAAEISNIVAFGVNATMGKFEPEVAFDASPELNEHEFVQFSMPDWPLGPVPGRPINAETMVTLVTKVNGHLERRRVMRAIAHYIEALRLWVFGDEVPCLARLYMGVEAISKAVLRNHMNRSGKTTDELATEWGVQRRDLESECRKRLVPLHRGFDWLLVV